jgi:Protein of unknown function (DUF2844)
MTIDTRGKLQLAAWLVSLAFGTLCALPSAHAALGEAEATVQADQAQMKATLRTLPNAKFTVHELKTSSGTTVREYVAPTGLVFGVVWQGPTMPDLEQLLGAYFNRYADGAAAQRVRRSPVRVEVPGLVVQSGGHMRAFSGKAYVPEGLPPGVVPEDLL